MGCTTDLFRVATGGKANTIVGPPRNINVYAFPKQDFGDLESAALDEAVFERMVFRQVTVGALEFPGSRRTWVRRWGMLRRCSDGVMGRTSGTRGWL